MLKCLLLNGPNLNLLGMREPDKYGYETLEDIETRVKEILENKNIPLQSFQSNAEHQLIECIHDARNQQIGYILFNPAAFTHTSVALRDALLAIGIPFAEIHITDPKAREPFRHTSYFTDIADFVVTGQGIQGYEIAATHAAKFIQSTPFSSF